MSEQLRAPDEARIAATAPNKAEVVVLSAGTAVLRIHPLGGAHPASWDSFRHWGPTTARFDHHPPPPKDHPECGVMYVTVGPDAFTTAVAEYFQDGSGAVGPIDPATCSPAATSFRVAADVALLDLSSPWVTRAGGNQAICSGRRSAARSWARAIHHHHPSIVGLRYRSSIWGPGTCIVLWERAAAAIPDGVVLHRALADATLDSPLAEAAQQLGAVLLP